MEIIIILQELQLKLLLATAWLYDYQLNKTLCWLIYLGLIQAGLGNNLPNAGFVESYQATWLNDIKIRNKRHSHSENV